MRHAMLTCCPTGPGPHAAPSRAAGSSFLTPASPDRGIPSACEARAAASNSSRSSVPIFTEPSSASGRTSGAPAPTMGPSTPDDSFCISATEPTPPDPAPPTLPLTLAPHRSPPLAAAAPRRPWLSSPCRVSRPPLRAGSLVDGGATHMGATSASERPRIAAPAFQAAADTEMGLALPVWNSGTGTPSVAGSTPTPDSAGTAPAGPGTPAAHRSPGPVGAPHIAPLPAGPATTVSKKHEARSVHAWRMIS